MSDAVKTRSTITHLCFIMLLIFVPNIIFGQENLSQNLTETVTASEEILVAHIKISELVGIIELWMIGSYLITFAVIGVIFRWPYLSSRVSQDILTGRPRAREDYEEEYAEWERQGNFSTTLLGFSIAALVFVFTFFATKLEAVQDIITFFSLGFVFEMISVLMYRHMVVRAYKYFGSLFQFLGILAFLGGLLVFILAQVANPILLWPIYLLGHGAFYGFTVRELLVMIGQMRSWRRRLLQRCSVCGKLWSNHTEMEREIHVQKERYWRSNE